MINGIVKIVGDYYKLSPDDINIVTRRRKISQPRQICHYFAHKYLHRKKYPLSKIGKIIGGKNHATVLNSVKVIENLIITDKEIRKEITEIDAIIKSNLVILNGDYISISENEIKEAIFSALTHVLRKKIELINKFTTEINNFNLKLKG